MREKTQAKAGIRGQEAMLKKDVEKRQMVRSRSVYATFQEKGDKTGARRS